MDPMIQHLRAMVRFLLPDKWNLTETEPGHVTDEAALSNFLSDPDKSILVSFPRTGSHWLRMLMELYFERPNLRRAFYYKQSEDYLTFHTHDLDLDTEHETVLYLYRNPVDTIYSQLKYHKEDPRNEERIRHWSDLYGQHLQKWLITEEFTRKKTVLTYEGMRADLFAEFRKITDHFDVDFEEDRFGNVASKVTKKEVKERTTHDPKVTNLEDEYERDQDLFKEEFGESVWGHILHGRSELRAWFDDVEVSP